MHPSLLDSVDVDFDHALVKVGTNLIAVEMVIGMLHADAGILHATSAQDAGVIPFRRLSGAALTDRHHHRLPCEQAYRRLRR